MADMMIVTIDGPAGSGKSSTARNLAKRLAFRFLDTGAMYRAIAWACLEQDVDPNDQAAVVATARRTRIEFDGDRVLVNGDEVSAAIRQESVTQASSVVAMHPDVRDELTRQQRVVAEGMNIVTEGRDQGSVVFPDAECKFFLTADPMERARRRHRELHDKNDDASLDEILEQIKERDRRDENRVVSPLVIPSDAVRIDTSHLQPTEVLDQLEQTVRARMSPQDA